MQEFDGETAIVTGAAQGIGRAIAERLGRGGANVVLADIQSEKVEETAAELREDGVTAEAVTCDVTDVEETDALAEAAEERFGTVEILVNNAGGAGGERFTELEPDVWRNGVELNLTGAYNCSYSVTPGMLEHGDGRVVNISSMAGRNVSMNGGPHYTAAKWGVIGLTKHMARDLGPDVRANAVCPGVTLTPMAKGATTEENRAAVSEGIPLGRWAKPSEQAEAAAFLASSASSYVTGTVIEVDGGGQLTPKNEG